jgi:hypothetical protein
MKFMLLMAVCTYMTNAHIFNRIKNVTKRTAGVFMVILSLISFKQHLSFKLRNKFIYF